MSTVGRLIHLTREVKGMAISELASAIGRSEGHLQHVENGMLVGTPETLLAVADKLNIDPIVLRDAYLQDAMDTALVVWNHSPKCKGKCIE
jgi:transcriptional regulator with XRE-family HTH domain